jgi:hypothetical protein
MSRLLLLALAVGLAACGSSSGSSGGTTYDDDFEDEGRIFPEDDRGRCETDGADLEVSEYDTSGDNHPDVRKVFRRRGDAMDMHLVLICREVDLNHDGIKDVVRYYGDEGRPVREQADRNFDGSLDESILFENGRVVQVDRDADYDGRMDTRIFYENRVPVRAERDMAGRSSEGEWRPDRWEYFDDGQVVRIGSDLDGDGRVDRWDRDIEYTRRLERERAAQEMAEANEDFGSDEDTEEGDEESEE